MLHTLHVGYIAVSIPSDSLINYLKTSQYINMYHAVRLIKSQISLKISDFTENHRQPASQPAASQPASQQPASQPACKLLKG
jgi:hypothetical protein